MGETAEVLAEQYKITRDEQDEFALASQTRAATAIAAGHFQSELVPVTIEGKKGATVFSRDEHPFADTSLEKLGKLAPVFSKSGTITAGNSSGITDGAAAVVLASEVFVKAHNLKPLARILAVTSAGVHPRIMLESQKEQTTSKVLIRSTGRLLLVDQRDICYASIEDGVISVVTAGPNGGEGQSNCRTLEELLDSLDSKLFWRAHRSYLVNINRIKEVVPWFKSSYQLRMDDKKQTEIPVSRAQTKRLRELFGL